MVEIVEGARGRARKLILDIGGATESLRGLLGLEAGDPHDGAGLTEVVIKLLLGSADIKPGDKHTGQVVRTVLVTVQVRMLSSKVWMMVDLVRDMAGDVASGLHV